MDTTIVNTPPANSSSDNSGMGFLVGIIILLVVGGLLLYFGLPYIRQMTNKGVQVNVPKDINVNVQQTK